MTDIGPNEFSADEEKAQRQRARDLKGENVPPRDYSKDPWNKPFPDKPKPVMPEFGKNRGL